MANHLLSAYTVMALKIVWSLGVDLEVVPFEWAAAA